MPQDLHHDQDEIGAPEQVKRLHRNGHVLQLEDVDWKCLHCQHHFDASADADAFWCGDPCACHKVTSGPFS